MELGRELGPRPGKLYRSCEEIGVVEGALKAEGNLQPAIEWKDHAPN